MAVRGHDGRPADCPLILGAGGDAVVDLDAVDGAGDPFSFAAYTVSAELLDTLGQSLSTPVTATVTQGAEPRLTFDGDELETLLDGRTRWSGSWRLLLDTTPFLAGPAEVWHPGAGAVSTTDTISATVDATTVALTISSVVEGGGGVSDHGALTGLTDDDHEQYLLADGSRTLAGNLTVTGTVDGRDVAADGTTLDAIPAGASIVTLTGTQTLTNKTINDASSNDVHANAVHFSVRNVSGVTITAGTPVYASGYNLGANLVEVEPADATSASTMPAVGLVEDDIATASTGTVIAIGTIESLDTSAWSVGDRLFVSETTGELTNTEPTGSAWIQQVGEVVRSNVATGAILVGVDRTILTGFAGTLIDDVDAATARTTLGLGSAATSDTGDFQPSDADLTAIAALSTTAYGRALLTLADQAALQTAANVEDGADVTDTANVTAAGALMDSEVTNLADVKAFDPADYATADAVSTHEADTTSVHGIADTSALLDTSSTLDSLSGVDTDKSKTPADGDVLTFDGTDWNAEAAAGGGSSMSRPPTTGSYWTLPNGAAVVAGETTSGLIFQLLHYGAVWQPQVAHRITDVMIECISTPGLTPQNVRIGLCEIDLADMQPAALVADWGVVDCATTGQKSVTGVTTDVEPGKLYATLLWSQHGGGNVTLRARRVGGAYGWGIDPAITNRTIYGVYVNATLDYSSGFSDPPSDWDTYMSTNGALGPLESVHFKIGATP